MPKPLTSRFRRLLASSSDGTNANLVLTGLVAICATVLFYLVIVWPLHKTYFGSLLAHRGPIPYVIVLMSTWSVGLLVQKYIKLCRQKDALALDLLPERLGKEINMDNVDAFQEHINSLANGSKHGFLVNRVRRALAHFKSRGNVQEVADQLSCQAEIEAGSVESSYAIIKVFIWAIPILGFIGTVLGISSAVGGFSESIQGSQELEVIKESLSGVTSGLAVAFDTTLLALVMSILIMFPARSLQKSEEDLLNTIDAYGSETILRRLDDGGRSQGIDAEQVKTAVDEAIGEHKADLKEWSGRLGTIGQQITSQVADGWEQIHQRVQDGQKRQAVAIQESLDMATGRQAELMGQIESLQDVRVKQLSDVMASMSETAGKVQQKLATMQETQALQAHELIGQVSGSLAAVKEKADSTRGEMDHAMRSAGEALSREIRGVAEEASQLFQAQAGQLGNLREAVEEQVAQFTGHLEQVRSTHTTSMATSQNEVLGRLSEVADSLARQAGLVQQEMASARQAQVEAAQQAKEEAQRQRAELQQVGNALVTSVSQELVGRLSEVADSLAQQAGLVQQEMVSTRQSQVEAAQKARQEAQQQRTELQHVGDALVSSVSQELVGRLSKVAASLGEQAGLVQQEMESAKQAQAVAAQQASQEAQHQRAELQQAGNAMVTSVFRELQQSLVSHQQTAEQASQNQLAALKAMQNALASSLGNFERTIGQHVSALGGVSEGQERMTAMGKALAAHVYSLTNDGALQQALGDIQQSLMGLHATIGEPADGSYVNIVGRPPGLGRRFRNWLKGGGNHG